MEKSKKLRRYSRKDYTQVVDFPVEIVGRDGVVRRYTFDESIRLYQRRIASAPNRYPDNEVVDAEVKHCRLRIEQLRKSYLHRYGWTAIRGTSLEGALVGAMAGEVAAFLRRFYGEEGDEDQLDIRWIHEEEHVEVFYVQLHGATDRYILYLYRFTHHGACEGREAFFRFLRLLQEVKGQQVEGLVAFHHTADCGLVLTGSGPLDDARRAWQEREHARSVARGATSEDAPHDARYAEALRLLAEGEPSEALDRLEAILMEEGGRREAALTAAAVADVLGQPERAEMAARLGVHYHPRDAAFHHHLGLARMRQLDLDTAASELRVAVALGPELYGTRALLALVLLREGKLDEAARLLPEEDRLEEVSDLRARVGMVRRALQLKRRSAVVSGAALLSGAALAAAAQHWAGLPLLLVGLGGLLVAAFARAALALQSGDEALRTLRVAAPSASDGGEARLLEPNA